MCVDNDSYPPITPIAGGSSGRDLRLTSSDGTRFMAYEARATNPTGAGMIVIPDVRGLHPELQRRKPPIQRIVPYQRRVRPLRDRHAAIEHDDPLRTDHGREPMSDDQRRPPRHQSIERQLHHALALGVERAGRLVEQENRSP